MYHPPARALLNRTYLLENDMRKIISTMLAAAAFGIVGTPVAAVAAGPATAPADPSVSDAYATQDPVAFNAQGPSTPCRTRRSVDCYWDVIGHTGRWGESYFVIRVGRSVCFKYWSNRYDRRHGHCESLREFHHEHRP